MNFRLAFNLFLKKLQEIDGCKDVSKHEIKELADALKNVGKCNIERSNLKEIVVGVGKFIICLIEFYKCGAECEKNLPEMRCFFEVILKVLDDPNISMINVFTRKMVPVIDNIVNIYKNTFYITKEVLRVYNVLLKNSIDAACCKCASKHTSLEILYNTAKNCEDIETQAVIIEIFLRLFSDNVMKPLLVKYFPEMDALEFGEYQDNQYPNVRKILNIINSTGSAIFPVSCNVILIDNVVVVEQEHQQPIDTIWIDFNVKHQKISFFCCKNFLKSITNLSYSSASTWEIISLSVNDIQKSKCVINSIDLVLNLTIKASDLNLFSKLDLNQYKTITISFSRQLETIDNVGEILNYLFPNLMINVELSQKSSPTVDNFMNPNRCKVSTMSMKDLGIPPSRERTVFNQYSNFTSDRSESRSRDSSSEASITFGGLGPVIYISDDEEDLQTIQRTFSESINSELSQISSSIERHAEIIGTMADDQGAKVSQNVDDYGSNISISTINFVDSMMIEGRRSSSEASRSWLNPVSVASMNYRTYSQVKTKAQTKISTENLLEKELAISRVKTSTFKVTQWLESNIPSGRSGSSSSSNSNLANFETARDYISAAESDVVIVTSKTPHTNLDESMSNGSQNLRNKDINKKTGEIFTSLEKNASDVGHHSYIKKVAEKEFSVKPTEALKKKVIILEPIELTVNKKSKIKEIEAPIITKVSEPLTIAKETNHNHVLQESSNSNSSERQNHNTKKTVKLSVITEEPSLLKSEATNKNVENISQSSQYSSVASIEESVKINPRYAKKSYKFDNSENKVGYKRSKKKANSRVSKKITKPSKKIKTTVKKLRAKAKITQVKNYEIVQQHSDSSSESWRKMKIRLNTHPIIESSEEAQITSKVKSDQDRSSKGNDAIDTTKVNDIYQDTLQNAPENNCAEESEIETSRKAKSRRQVVISDSSEDFGISQKENQVKEDRLTLQKHVELKKLPPLKPNKTPQREDEQNIEGIIQLAPIQNLPSKPKDNIKNTSIGSKSKGDINHVGSLTFSQTVNDDFSKSINDDNGFDVNFVASESGSSDRRMENPLKKVSWVNRSKNNRISKPNADILFESLLKDKSLPSSLKSHVFDSDKEIGYKEKSDANGKDSPTNEQQKRVFKFQEESESKPVTISENTSTTLKSSKQQRHVSESQEESDKEKSKSVTILENTSRGPKSEKQQRSISKLEEESDKEKSKSVTISENTLKSSISKSQEESIKEKSKSTTPKSSKQQRRVSNLQEESDKEKAKSITVSENRSTTPKSSKQQRRAPKSQEGYYKERFRSITISENMSVTPTSSSKESSKPKPFPVTKENLKEAHYAYSDEGDEVVDKIHSKVLSLHNSDEVEDVIKPTPTKYETEDIIQILEDVNANNNSRTERDSVLPESQDFKTSTPNKVFNSEEIFSIFGIGNKNKVLDTKDIKAADSSLKTTKKKRALFDPSDLSYMDSMCLDVDKNEIIDMNGSKPRYGKKPTNKKNDSSNKSKDIIIIDSPKTPKRRYNKKAPGIRKEVTKITKNDKSSKKGPHKFDKLFDSLKSAICKSKEAKAKSRKRSSKKNVETDLSSPSFNEPFTVDLNIHTLKRKLSNKLEEASVPKRKKNGEVEGTMRETNKINIISNVVLKPPQEDLINNNKNVDVNCCDHCVNIFTKFVHSYVEHFDRHHPVVLASDVNLCKVKDILDKY